MATGPAISWMYGPKAPRGCSDPAPLTRRRRGATLSIEVNTKQLQGGVQVPTGGKAREPKG